MVWHKTFNRCSHGNSFISDTQLKPPVYRQFYKHQTVHFAKLQLRDLRGTIPSMQPLLCPPKCALNFVQTAFRDRHDLNNLIQESFTRTQCFSKKRCQALACWSTEMWPLQYVYSDIHAIITAKVGLTTYAQTALLCNLTFSVNWAFKMTMTRVWPEYHSDATRPEFPKQCC